MYILTNQTDDLLEGHGQPHLHGRARVHHGPDLRIVVLRSEQVEHQVLLRPAALASCW